MYYDVRFKTWMLRSSLSNYSDACIPVQGSVTVSNTAAAAAPVKNVNKKVLSKNFMPFIKCISRINMLGMMLMILM